jgi:hypothetical protein
MTTRPIACTFAAILTTLSLGCSSPKATQIPGASSSLGNGTVASYAELDATGAPHAIGVVFTEGALDALPTAPSDGHHCFDTNKDEKIDVATECSQWHERVLPIPSALSGRADVPFKWAMLNWNPHGHPPPGVWDKPHFDIHFYIEPIENIFSLQRGTCGPEFLRCDQFALAIKPVPKNYVPANYQDAQVAAPAMGNHMIDPMGHEFHGQEFKRHWIFGIYDARIIFYEEMVALSYMTSKPDECLPIPSTPAVAITGYYPTKSCVRYQAGKGQYTISIEDFVLRQASPPEPLRDVSAGKP